MGGHVLGTVLGPPGAGINNIPICSRGFSLTTRERVHSPVCLRAAGCSRSLRPWREGDTRVGDSRAFPQGTHTRVVKWGGVKVWPADATVGVGKWWQALGQVAEACVLC